MLFNKKNLVLNSVFILFVLALTGCNQFENSGQSMFSQGQDIYEQYCQDCHDNPTARSSLVPSISNVALDVLEAKVWNGRYPDGYISKREAFYMPVFSKEQIADLQSLHFFLNNISHDIEGDN